MKDIFGYLLSALSILCVVNAMENEVFSSDHYINQINEVQRQWRAGHNFDLTTETSLLNFYLNKLEEPLTPKIEGRSFWSAIGSFFGIGRGRKRKPAANTTPATIVDGNATTTDANATTTATDAAIITVFTTIGSSIDTTTIKPMVEEEKTDLIVNEGLPFAFDARDRWPLCRDTIFKIIESSLDNDCSTDWATSVVGAIEDRYCIKNGVTNRTFSVSQIVECSLSCKECCQQGSVEVAYDYFKKFGVPSGAQTESPDVQNAAAGCRPYSNSAFKDKNSCLKECPNKKYETSFEEDLVKIHDYYSLSTDPSIDYNGRVRYSNDRIKQEIWQFGSVTANINFYHDLIYYKEGIYAPTDAAKLMDKISVKVIGWGAEVGKEYWLVSNIWKQSWGNKGFAKLEAWNTKLDLESWIMAGRL